MSYSGLLSGPGPVKGIVHPKENYPMIYSPSSHARCIDDFLLSDKYNHAYIKKGSSKLIIAVNGGGGGQDEAQESASIHHKSAPTSVGS